MDNLRALGASSIITDLMHTPRPLSGIEMANNISDIFLNKPVNQWESEFPSIDSPGGPFNRVLILYSFLEFNFPEGDHKPKLKPFFKLKHKLKFFLLNLAQITTWCLPPSSHPP